MIVGSKGIMPNRRRDSAIPYNPSLADSEREGCQAKPDREGEVWVRGRAPAE